MLDLLIWWQLNGMWGYLLFERLQCVKLCMDEYFLHLFGIITISTTRVDFFVWVRI